MKILLDMDGVLSDFVGAICKAHNVENPYLHKENYGKFSMEVLMGITPTEFWSVCEEDFWENLEVLDGAKKLVNFLENNFDLDNICLLSSPSKNLGCIQGKMKWIRKHFPQFDRRCMFGPRKEFCAHSNSLLIDDYHHNTDKFSENGGKSCLLPRVWNTNHHIAHNIEDDWKYVANYLFEKGILK